MLNSKQFYRQVTVVAALCLLAVTSTATAQEMEEESLPGLDREHE